MRRTITFKTLPLPIRQPGHLNGPKPPQAVGLNGTVRKQKGSQCACKCSKLIVHLFLSDSQGCAGAHIVRRFASREDCAPECGCGHPQELIFPFAQWIPAWHPIPIRSGDPPGRKGSSYRREKKVCTGCTAEHPHGDRTPVHPPGRLFIAVVH